MKEYIMRYENELLQLLPDKMQELVRCKDCYYGIRNSKEDIFCIKAIYNDKYKRPDWFCADGKRRTDDA